MVPKAHVEVVWSQIEKYVDGAAKYTYGRFNTHDIKQGIIDKPEQQLWIAFDDTQIYGFWVTEPFTYPQMKVLILHFIGGEKFKKWQTMALELTQKYARDHNCKIMESYGRPGWEKIWKDNGYKELFTFYELPVEK